MVRFPLRSPRFVVLRFQTVSVTFAVTCLVLAWWWAAPQLALPVFMPTERISGKLVVVDPGHGGADPGAVGRSGVLEKEVVLSIARELETLLNRAAIYTLLLRDGDYDLASEGSARAGTRKQQDLSLRVERANEAGADLYVSLHANSIPSPRWSGAQTFYYPGKEEGKRLAEAIQARFQQAFPENHRLARPGEYFVLKQTAMPAVVVEVGFLSNPDEERLLIDPNYQKILADAIYRGIIDYFLQDRN